MASCGAIGQDGDRDQNQQGQNNRALASTSQGSAEGGNYSQIWTIDPIDPGQTRIIQSTATVTQTQQTELISLPALALSVIDVQDPVRLGEEVTYRIIVRNEGTAADSNVRVNVELPEELEHVESGGASEGTADDQRQVTFEPVQQIVAGQELSWQLRAKANQPGNIALTVRLESEGLGRQGNRRRADHTVQRPGPGRLPSGRYHRRRRWESEG